MASLLRAGVISITLFLFVLPPAVSAQTTCSSVTDHGKTNPTTNATCYCPNAATRCEWRGAGSPTTQVGGQTQVTDPSALINNQLINNGTSEPPPVTSAELRTVKRPDQKFRALAGVPGITNLGSITMPQMLNALYRTLIVIGALIAVLKITLAGLKYMGSDSFGSKASAKEDITASLLGLLILLATVLIINTILGSVNLNVLQGPQIPLPQQAPPTLNPSESTVSVKKEAGCGQLAANNISCQSGSVGTISKNTVTCYAGSVPNVSGQSTFKPVTEAQCTQTNAQFRNTTAETGNIAEMIKNGTEVIGYTQIPTSQARDKEAKARELEADCRAGGGSKVTFTAQANTAVINGVTTPTTGFICSK